MDSSSSTHNQIPHTNLTASIFFPIEFLRVKECRQVENAKAPLSMLCTTQIKAGRIEQERPLDTILLASHSQHLASAFAAEKNPTENAKDTSVCFGGSGGWRMKLREILALN
jgi:hypothetical protein